MMCPLHGESGNTDSARMWARPLEDSSRDCSVQNQILPHRLPLLLADSRYGEQLFDPFESTLLVAELDDAFRQRRADPGQPLQCSTVAVFRLRTNSRIAIALMISVHTFS